MNLSKAITFITIFFTTQTSYAFMQNSLVSSTKAILTPPLSLLKDDEDLVSKFDRSVSETLAILVSNTKVKTIFLKMISHLRLF